MQKFSIHTVAAAGLCAAISAALAISPAVSAQEADAGELEVIVVTAQKREEDLADIPMSITVLGGSMLERQQIDNFEDIVTHVPGFSLNRAQPGVSRITLRGINTGGSASTVGVYYDEVPFGSSSGLANGAVLSGDFDTFDLARIEVLRGPQGTLYGASSLGGVLKYVPNRPSTEGFEARFKGSLESVKDGDLGYAGTGVINVPLSDTFAIRATAFYRYDDGYIDSIGNNPIPTLTDPDENVIEGTQIEDDLNEAETYGGRFAALFAPSDDFSIDLVAMFQDINSDSLDFIDADPATLDPLNSDPVQSRYQDAYSDISYEVYSATIDWDFGPASLESITSWGDFEQNWQQDLALAIPLAGVPLSSLLTFLFDDPATPEIAPKLSAILPQIVATEKFTQEVRIVSPVSESFEWLLGGYYTDEDSILDQQIFAVNAGTETVTPGFPVLAVASIESGYEELAFFGNATWHVTPRFDLSFGARASDNDQDAVQTTSGPLAGGVETIVTGESSESPFTWSFSPRYEVSDNASLYFRVATGFRPGGPNIVPPGAPPEVPTSYDSDSLTSYEAGYKAASADGRFAFDVTGYYLDWDDIQLLTTVNAFSVIANGGKAKSKGIETSASFMPSEGLTLSVNGAYTDAELAEDTDPQLGGLDGDPLPFVPEWSFGASADYEWNLANGWTAYVGGTLGYTGDRPAGLSERDANGEIIDVDNYTTVNVRAGIDSGRWLFEVYAKNLTDESGITFTEYANTPYTGRVELGIIRPATFGASAGVRF